ncbi:MAG: radical SAM protein [Candidatus Bathyarchaeota archaeon]|nr:MAG: radical SAM protein [Candidatus Bathyarchaeota archaeon]
MRRGSLPEKIRVSIGSAIVLGLTKGMMDAKPTTTYLLTYRPEKCSANCGFCPQARMSKGRADMLSRVTWPSFPTEQVISKIGRAVKTGSTKRVCIQALNYPTVFDDVSNLTTEILSRIGIPVSVSCQPINRGKMERLREAGIDRISIPLDAATHEIFDRVKGRLVGGSYMWKKQREALEEAVQIFGRGFVSTHLIVGLGEEEREMVQTIQWCVDLGVYPGLFSFTSIPGTALENQPQLPLRCYRRIQLAHYLITHGKTRYESMDFGEAGRIVDFAISKELFRRVIRKGSPFVTSGCPNCNRPYYNERPGGPIYNYPRQPSPKEIAEIERQIQM